MLVDLTPAPGDEEVKGAVCDKAGHGQFEAEEIIKGEMIYS